MEEDVGRKEVGSSKWVKGKRKRKGERRGEDGRHKLEDGEGSMKLMSPKNSFPVNPF